MTATVRPRAAASPLRMSQPIIPSFGLATTVIVGSSRASAVAISGVRSAGCAWG